MAYRIHNGTDVMKTREYQRAKVIKINLRSLFQYFLIAIARNE